ncbi:hypothetical protein PMAA_069650 [Talaromyces marneffei ATCC 18224]|uniref:Nephrocystin 3-like N-terminal domain-containing protein n=1 Tax=Talaromyces marneffei (strain ATCC 18224 / CBS 334.59 / QM 7333) TaxID=441960 RepID=B6Q8R7_TALMQ|nr:hypothetical protein PMAA_069650 [Talaromyces marneffei ATCC 18224]
MAVSSTQGYFQDLQDRKHGSEDVSLLFETYIVKPLSKVNSQVFIVIDGIDECLFMGEDLPHFDDKSSAILESFTKLQCQCLLTSRPMPISNGKLSLWLHHRLTTENLEDIRGGFERLGQHA